MTRLARAEVFAPDEIAVVHVMNRVVRRCFLFGDDPLTGKNYDHRKDWIESRLQQLAASFGIDLLGFAILSNHFHLILRSRPDVVEQWDDTQVARRWLTLCPLQKLADGTPKEPSEQELNSIRNDPVKVAQLRMRLSDISRWMRLLCQTIAQRANQEDQEIGRFWQNRYRSVRLLDETALLACAAYVDLNPIRAAIAETLEASDFTSAQRRLAALRPQPQADPEPEHAAKYEATGQDSADATGQTSAACQGADDFLSPVAIDEANDPPGPQPSHCGTRCSDKGFLPISTAAYLELIDWTARHGAAGKRGVTPADAPPIFQRLSIGSTAWCELVQGFGRLFSNVAGRPQVIEEARSRIHHRRYRIDQRIRGLLAEAA